VLSSLGQWFACAVCGCIPLHSRWKSGQRGRLNAFIGPVTMCVCFWGTERQLVPLPNPLVKKRDWSCWSTANTGHKQGPSSILLAIRRVVISAFECWCYIKFKNTNLNPPNITFHAIEGRCLAGGAEGISLWTCERWVRTKISRTFILYGSCGGGQGKPKFLVPGNQETTRPPKNRENARKSPGNYLN
jgi:hypothetical protein